MFNEKVAIITGAANGIGKAIAKKCLEHKMKIALIDNDKENLDIFQKELNDDLNNILAIQADVSNEQQLKLCSEVIVSKFGSIHYLFNNAGIPGEIAPLWECKSDEIERVFRVNVFGVVYGIKIFVPIMLKQKDECFIVNTCAGAGFLTGKGMCVYKASKHAITAITESTYADLKSSNANITISLLIPHLVKTDIANKLKTNDSVMREAINQQLQNEGVSPDLVAHILFDSLNKKIFYIFTHPDQHLSKVRKRMTNILSLEDPC